MTIITLIISRITLEIPEGKLVVVVGRVGSGKSSLIQAMIGEMRKLDGNISLKVFFGIVQFLQCFSYSRKLKKFIIWISL